MKRSPIPLPAIVLCLSALFAHAAPPMKTTSTMVSRSFDIKSSFFEQARTLGEEIIMARNGEFMGMGPGGLGATRTDLKDFFGQLGVTWPEGSFIKYIPATGKLLIKNTPENMKRIEALLPELDATPFRVEIETQFVQFSMEEISDIAGKGIVDMAALKKLRSKGKAKLLAVPKVFVHSGEEATVKAVKEYIYPTEFEVEPITGVTSNDYAVIIGGVVEPGSFETREVGVILSAMPEVRRNSDTISISLTAEIVKEPVWKNYGSGYKHPSGYENHLPMEEPFFFTYSTYGSLTVKNGSTVLAGGGMNSEDGKQVVYIFVTARLVDIEGNPMKK